MNHACHIDLKPWVACFFWAKVEGHHDSQPCLQVYVIITTFQDQDFPHVYQLESPESVSRDKKNKTPLATDLEKRRNGCRETWHLVKSFKRSLKCGRFSHYISHYSTTSWKHWQLCGRCPTMRFKLIHWKIFGKDILERYACLFLHA